jgi:5-methylcytosine-specific restriction protein A
MPNKCPHPCNKPGCHRLTTERFCAEHAKEKWRDDNRDSFRERGYDSRWDHVRALKMSLDPLCEVCTREGKTVVAEIVHHIKPLNRGGELLDMDNLLSVCRVCHGKLHSK